MSLRINSSAVYDSLGILCLVQPHFGPLLQPEVHMFAYLACTLSLYRARPLADWGYSFAGVAMGFPFSRDLTDAIELNLSLGHIATSTSSHTLELTPRGAAEFASLSEMSVLKNRLEYLEAAVSSANFLPPPILRQALARQAPVAAAAELGSPRNLLDDTELAIIYEQFSVLSAEIGVDIKELMIPAVIWLKYLLGSRQE